MSDLIPLPAKRYKTIVADAPWTYRNKNTGGSMVSGSNAKYPVMTIQQVKELPVPEIAHKDAVLFLWVTTPLKNEIAQAKIVEKWGFQYKTSIYWHKTVKVGLGFWFRGQVEECWVCTRGKVKAFRDQHANIIHSKPGQHSQKPEEFFELIDPIIDKYRLDPRVELFARQKRLGWDAWGFDVDWENEGVTDGM